MDKLKGKAKSLPRKHQEDQYTTHQPKGTEKHARGDLTKEEREMLQKEKKKKLKNSDIFVVKKSKTI